MKQTNPGLIVLAGLILLTSACSKNPVKESKATGTVARSTYTFTNPLYSGAQPDPYFYPQKDPATGMFYYLFSEGDRLSIRAMENPAYVKWTLPTTLFMGSKYGLSQIWAPELHKINGFWYLYFTATNDGTDAGHRIYMIKSTHADPRDLVWTAPIQVRGISGFAIDPNIMQSADGKTQWLLWTTRGSDGYMRTFYGKLQYPEQLYWSKKLIEPTLSWEKADGPVTEAPEFLRKDASNVWYIYYSANGTNSPDKYCLGRIFLKQGGSPDEPSDWIKHPYPVFSTSTANSVYSPGHCSFFIAGSQWWIAYHAKSTYARTYDGRTARIQPFNWVSGNTPSFGAPVSTSTSLTCSTD